MFSNHAGAPTDRPMLDDDPRLYEIQKKQKALAAFLQGGIDATILVTEECERLGIRSYILAPCIVYGKGEGFGNPISIQTVAIVKAAKGVGRVYKFDEKESFWPVSHVADTATLYIHMLEKMLLGEDIAHGRNGFYLASCGSMSWDRIYSGIAENLKEKGVIHDSSVVRADDGALEKIANALGCPKELVEPQLAGNCSLVAKQGYDIGWKPEYPADHILESLDGEVTLILEILK